MAHRSIENAVRGAPDMTRDEKVIARKDELVKEASYTLEVIRGLGMGKSKDPLADAAVIAQAVTSGIMDAPQLRNNTFARGTDLTMIKDGASVAVDETGKVMTEKDRKAKLGIN